MKLVTAAAQLPRPLPRPIVAIGTFDGVHRAHQAIIRRVVQVARRTRGTSVVVSFDPHPQHVLRPGFQPRLLTRADQRLEYFRALGVDLVWLIRFTRRFARLSPETFFSRLIVQALQAQMIVVGSSFGFGQGRRGNLASLSALGRAAGVAIQQVPDVLDDGAPITSSRIRAAIAEGRLREAARWLGRPVLLRGRVVHGVARGRRLGFPTANLDYDHLVLPLQGVYVVHAQVGARTFPGVANVGQRPTFKDAAATTVEVHVLGRHPRLYGRTITVEWLRRLREEHQFTSRAALQRQIAADIDEAQQFFHRQHRAPAPLSHPRTSSVAA